MKNLPLRGLIVLGVCTVHMVILIKYFFVYLLLIRSYELLKILEVIVLKIKIKFIFFFKRNKTIVKGNRTIADLRYGENT